MGVSEEHRSHAKAMDIPSGQLGTYVETGILTCAACRLWFPLTDGVPVMMLYPTPAAKSFQSNHQKELAQLPGYELPHQQPVRGEEHVMTSFSEEWRDYSYDGVLWNNTYADLEQMFLHEIGDLGSVAPRSSLEIGCGLGLTTELCYRYMKGDAVGVDLSVACFRAAAHFKSNPFLHFVQASVFSLPFTDKSFDFIYSRGVLHHTYSTADAFSAASRHCKPGGHFYLWVYGLGSNDDTLFRRLAHLVEAVCRPVLSRAPSAPLTRATLVALTAPYRAVNWLHRIRNPGIQHYDFDRALHAARDRLTPRYAHRHESSEVVRWFQEARFGEVEIVDWQTMPEAQRDTFRRNIGVRGRRLPG